MGNFCKYVYVDEVNKQIITNVEKLPCTEGTNGGFLLTGFIDIEKIIYSDWYGKSKATFLEKKFPFSVLVLPIAKEKYGDGKGDND